MPQWEKLDRLDKIRYLTILKILGPYAKPASKVVKNIKNQASKIRFGDDHDMSMSYAVNTGLDIDISKSCDDVLQAINR